MIMVQMLSAVTKHLLAAQPLAVKAAVAAKAHVIPVIPAIPEE